MRGLRLGFTNPVGTEGVRDVCLWLGCCGVGGVEGSRLVPWSMIWEGGIVLYMCCESGFCVYGRSRYLSIVLIGYLHILGTPSVQSCCTL